MHVRAITLGLFLLAVSACSDETGPGTSNTQFVNLYVNNKLWKLEQPVAQLSYIQQLYIYGDYLVADSGLRYHFDIGILPFDGTGNYPLGPETGDEFTGLWVSDSSGAFGSVYNVDPRNFGSLHITEYRTSDSTVSGNFSARLVDLDDSTVHVDIHGNFRLSVFIFSSIASGRPDTTGET